MAVEYENIEFIKHLLSNNKIDVNKTYYVVLQYFNYISIFFISMAFQNHFIFNSI